jgi:hypothetical protein
LSALQLKLDHLLILELSRSLTVQGSCSIMWFLDTTSLCWDDDSATYRGQCQKPNLELLSSQLAAYGGRVARTSTGLRYDTDRGYFQVEKDMEQFTIGGTCCKEEAQKIAHKIAAIGLDYLVELEEALERMRL